MTNKDFVDRLVDIARNQSTLYVMGCFGAPMTEKNKKRYTNNHSYNMKWDRKRMILNATETTFGFDCIGLLKAEFWGWWGSLKSTYGGAVYQSNGVPDVNADQMFDMCSGKTSDFKNIEIGEALWMKGHIGVYIGSGLAVECTPKWENDVQITAVKNMGSPKGYNKRKWEMHGKLPWIEYK